jgi:hypothetical protein
VGVRPKGITPHQQLISSPDVLINEGRVFLRAILVPVARLRSRHRFFFPFFRMKILLPRKLPAQFHFGPFQRTAPRGGQVLTSAIDVEHQHRQSRAIGICLAPMALFRGAFERCGDALGVAPSEHASFEVERVAFSRYPPRPVASTATAGRSPARCLATYRLPANRFSAVSCLSHCETRSGEIDPQQRSLLVGSRH